ncbi:MAG: hypothetical protein QM713_11360 [Arachnia sp.]
MSDEASSLNLLLDGVHARTGSRIQSRVRMSRQGSVVVADGLLPTPGVAASRMVSKLAVVDVAGGIGPHPRSQGVGASKSHPLFWEIAVDDSFQVAVEGGAEVPVGLPAHCREAASQDLGDVVVEAGWRGAGDVR